MKIVQLCISESLGGLEQVFEKYTRLFHQQSKHESLGVVLQHSALHQRLQQDGVPFYTLPSHSALEVLPNALRLARLLEECEADILHMHLKKDLTTAVLAKMFCRRKLKLLYTRHMHIANSKKDPWHRFFYQKIDLYITITEQMRQEALRFIPLPANAIKRLYTGVKAPEQFHQDLCREFFQHEPSGEKFRVGIFARIDPHKGQHLVLQAAAKLKKKYPQLHYYMVGLATDESYHQSLHKITEQEGLTDVVHFPGFHKYPTAIMPCFDVVLLASAHETFGLVLPEAMRAGVAVIGADAGGVQEIIDHNDTGLLFRPGDADDMAEKIETVYLQQDLRQKLAKQGKEKADRLFSEEAHFAELEELYHQVVS
ncbi:glycosyltransferase family 4 protein [Pontibacter qinzhouensis]|uniref:Glycosyltransferase family 4 protein n=1 Tax=Pontibacter qinzhouensis TaxID=2603253 RepID=A0A5C8KB85_9BACT|nr:glycosyltransferase family 4 protein [Pontibacter qinzhouensis]TXK47654.1 glycosyltransferase family 4 protein [Pontibacter qinzhouensis]